MPTTVLTIAGSDPSGGAGIQADLRTFAALGVHGVSAITALTVQNSQGVFAIHAAMPYALGEQLDAVFLDYRPDAVKIGMLGNIRQVKATAEALARHHARRVVLDPILASTAGVPLLDDAGLAALLQDLLPLCTIVTPNLPEALALTGEADEDKAVAVLFNHGAPAVLVKGGHRDGVPADILYRPGDEPLVCVSERVDTPHTHGTGCLLSSAIAAFLALGRTLPDSIRAAKDLMTEALRRPIIAGSGIGHPNPTAAAVIVAQRERHAERLARLRGVYVLTDPDLRPDRSAEEIAGAALAGGATVVQYRDKNLTTPQMIEQARRLAVMVQSAGGIFIVNDRVDVTLASGADGVHLGPDDMLPADARAILGPERLIGASVSTVAEAQVHAPYVSYFGVGAVFGSKTKADAGAPIGPARLSEIKAAFPHIPIVAIGGITHENAAIVAQSGADAAAVVSAVVCAPDMAEAVRSLRQTLEK